MAVRVGDGTQPIAEADWTSRVAVEGATFGRGGRRRGRVHALDVAVTALLAGTVALLALALVAEILGYQAVVIESGSMEPTIAVGDVIVSQAVHPLEVRPGDIVTFRDPALGERLVTHRVVTERLWRDHVNFVTKGDANRTTEHWDVPISGMLGRELLVVPLPQAGPWLTLVTGPMARVTEILASVTLLFYLALRYIWRGPQRSV
ncbi:MAG: signal peptidase I [Candidatus Dormibacteria bacterium]